MPRRKKARRKLAGTTQVKVSLAKLRKVVHLGASHHAALADLKRTIRAAPKKAKKKARKKATRRRKTTRRR
jgi:hypothetical protein